MNSLVTLVRSAKEKQERGEKMSELEKELERLRRIHCTCDDGTLCAGFSPKGLTKECREDCEAFCKMWDELEKLFFQRGTVIGLVKK